MKRIFKFIEKYYFIIILLSVAVSLVFPNSFQWVLSNYGGVNSAFKHGSFYYGNHFESGRLYQCV